MIHKTPWKLGFITMITGGKLESQEQQKGARYSTPASQGCRQLPAWTEAAFILQQPVKHSPWELLKRYPFMVCFQIPTVLCDQCHVQY